MDALDSRRLLDARTGTEQLLHEALVRLELLTEADPSWLEELIAQLAPADDRGYWLLTALATQDRAIGTAEAWLDQPDLPGDVRDFLAHLLSMVLATGQGAELTEERLGAAVADALWTPRRRLRDRAADQVQPCHPGDDRRPDSPCGHH